MFYINNTSNLDIGAIAKEEDFMSRAPIIYNEYQIEGKDGSDFDEKCFGNVVGSITIYISPRNLDKAKSLFIGKKKLSINRRTTEIYFFDFIDVKRYGNMNECTINFIRNPFWYKKNDSYVKQNSNIFNDGNYKAKPILKLVGNGTVKITINDISFTYTFDDDDYVVIDCHDKTEKANSKVKSKNIKIGFEYPILKPGENHLKIEGDATLFIKRKECWL